MVSFLFISSEQNVRLFLFLSKTKKKQTKRRIIIFFYVIMRITLGRDPDHLYPYCSELAAETQSVASAGSN